MATPRLFVDGHAATADDLAHQALVNYGAYTAFRVEDGGVRGLDLHLDRLHASAIELFGEAVGEDRLRQLMRDAVGDRRACFLRISLFSPEISTRHPHWRGAPRVMIGVFDPPPPLAGPLRVQSQTYVRDTPHLKHLATMGLLAARRRATASGFDDALLADGAGLVSEGTLWNIGFVEGDRIVWPQAPMLAGVTQAVLRQGWAAAGLDSDSRPIRLDDLPSFRAAFLCNSTTPAAPVTAIDALAYEPDVEVIDRLQALWAAAPIQPI